MTPFDIDLSASFKTWNTHVIVYLHYVYEVSFIVVSESTPHTFLIVFEIMFM